MKLLSLVAIVMSKRWVLCVDMDAFFASVEVIRNERLRGKPVIVGADPEKGRGVVSSASYEARRFGIHSAMPITRAYRLCPNGVFLRPDFRLYKSYSAKIIAILKDFSPTVEQASIDEAFVELTGTELLFGGAEKVAYEIKRRIKTELKLNCTIGLAPNKLLAKIATKVGKPDGFIVIPHDKVDDFLSPLPVETITGIGSKISLRLAELGARRVGNLRELPLYLLRNEFGKLGDFLYSAARGIDNTPVKQRREVKQISREITFDADTEDVATIRSAFRELAEDVFIALEAKKLFARTVFVKVRYPDFLTRSKAKSFAEPFCSFEFIFKVGWNLIQAVGLKRLRLIGVGVSGLVSPYGLPLSLFPDHNSLNRMGNLLSELKRRFGNNWRKAGRFGE